MTTTDAVGQKNTAPYTMCIGGPVTIEMPSFGAD